MLNILNRKRIFVPENIELIYVFSVRIKGTYGPESHSGHLGSRLSVNGHWALL